MLGSIITLVFEGEEGFFGFATAGALMAVRS